MLSLRVRRLADRLDGDELDTEVLDLAEEAMKLRLVDSVPVSTVVPATRSSSMFSKRNANSSPNSPLRVTRYL